jgi:hypothetical protein
MPLRRSLQPWLAFALFVLLVVANSLWFVRFDQHYLAWYIRSGVLVGVLTAVFSTAWGDLDKNTLLISANPLVYLRGCLLLVSLPLQSLGGQIESVGKLLSGKVEGRRSTPWITLDAAAMLPSLLVLLLLLLVWLVLIAPIQYFVFIFSGALARSLLHSPTRLIASGGATTYQIAVIRHDAPVPSGWWDASLSRKPVALTAALSSLLLLGLKTLLKL